MSNSREAVAWTTAAGAKVGLLHRQTDSEDVGALADYMLIHDPENKARYLVPAGLARRTVGRADYGENAQSFLCMLHQKGRCRAKKLCNQVHLPAPLVDEVREYAKSRVEGQYTAQKRHVFVDEVKVWDKRLKRVVTLPYHLTLSTAGRRDASKGATVDLCTFFSTPAGCKYGTRCKGIHVKAVYHETQSLCCPAHAAQATPRLQAMQDYRCVVTASGHSEPSVVSADFVLPSKGLQRLLSRETEVVKLCVRHLQTRCHHKHNCNNVHVCRRLFADPDVLSAPHCSLQFIGHRAPSTVCPPVHTPSMTVCPPVHTPSMCPLAHSSSVVSMSQRTEHSSGSSPRGPLSESSAASPEDLTAVSTCDDDDDDDDYPELLDTILDAIDCL
eukprot:TRINITY_DN3403_c0_g1_i1.p1 TRINITY_DN3403_c0_g1~~TRINITY_DN3403_c0_g1_i1.p1  ORF type:complete len:386 (+),score=92.95 TRINITY_DN3403_c0_g1_i1:50-1207(+)